MSDLYRKLLHDIAERFGGTVDDANADAIAYAAAELYHRDFEPRLWEEKSAHDLLDLFGIPRAGVFAPYSLSDRLLLFQRRSSGAEYVTRAHEVLTSLGVPRQDEDGVDQNLKWRLEKVLASVNHEDESSEDDMEVEDADGPSDDEADRASSADDEPGDGEGKSEPEPAGATNGNGRGGERVVAGFGLFAAKSDSKTSTGVGAEQSSSSEPTPAQLVDAVRALEHAADVEAQLATPVAAGDGSNGVDLVGLSETLSGIQGEIAALRELVEAFEIGMRRQLDELQSQLNNTNHASATLPPAQPSGPAPLVPSPADPTHEMAPVLLGDEQPGLLAEGDAPVRRRGRRVLLVILLALLGVLIAGGIAVAVAVGWDTIRSESGLLLPLGGAGRL